MKEIELNDTKAKFNLAMARAAKIKDPIKRTVSEQAAQYNLDKALTQTPESQIIAIPTWQRSSLTNWGAWEVANEK